jgi:hypothetical protein
VIPVVPQRRRCWQPRLLHLNFGDALAHAKHLRWLDRQRGCDRSKRRVVIYYCPLHSAWHVGHEPVSVLPESDEAPAVTPKPQAAGTPEPISSGELKL